MFISYSHEDYDWVWNTLIPELKRTAISYYIDAQDFQGGRALILNMQAGVMRSRHTVAVLSPAYAASKPGAFERLLALTQEPSTKSSPLIPIMIADCYDLMEPYLSMLYVYEMRTPREQARNLPRLLAQIQGKDEYVSEDEAPAKEPWSPRYYHPPAGVVPDWFVERPYETERLLRALGLADGAQAEAATSTTVALTTAVQGMGGVGKTVLAAHILRHPRVRERWPGGQLWSVLGPEALEEESADGVLTEWAQALGLDLKGQPTVEAKARAICGRLQGSKVLLVLDDVWSAAPLRVLRACAPEGCGFLYTTRLDDIARALDKDPVQVDLLKPEQALDLLGRRAGAGAMARISQAEAAELCQRLGYLPLAIDIAAANLAAGLAVQEYLTALRQHQGALELLDLGDLKDRLSGARTCFQVSLEHLPGDADRERFCQLGVLAPELPFGPADAAIVWGASPTIRRC